MKTTVSIWCVATLSLFAMGARAQLDSNMLVTIHSSRICNDCEMSVAGVLDVPPFDTVWQYQEESLCLSPDTSFNGVGLSIDTNQKLLFGLKLSGSGSQTLIPGSQAYAFFFLNLIFDSIPYQDSANLIIARGIFPCLDSFS
ncbi:MAG TPA: hypothetical protein VFX22_06415, partial [Candidatus Kapabacteria bacterium]|nr:hypothetical protein [Candidatus Kapabacteria bacterium]